MTQSKITLDGVQTEVGKEVNLDALYLVDFTKITSVNDLVLLLASMGISFSGRHPHFELVKPFLALDNPITPGVPPQQQPIGKEKFAKMELPKLKTV